MAFFRQYIAPLIVVMMFLFALFVVSARIFLPGDMTAPAPIGMVLAPTGSELFWVNPIRV